MSPYRDFCIEMEKYQVACVPIPTNESQWDENTMRWRSIISQKHAEQAASELIYFFINEFFIPKL